MFCLRARLTALRGRAIDTVERLEKRARRSAADGVPDGLPVPTSGDQTIPAENGEMLGHGRVADAKKLGELADRPLLLDELAEDQQPMRVGERFEQVAGLLDSRAHPFRLYLHIRSLFS